MFHFSVNNIVHMASANIAQYPQSVTRRVVLYASSINIQRENTRNDSRNHQTWYKHETTAVICINKYYVAIFPNQTVAKDSVPAVKLSWDIRTGIPVTERLQNKRLQHLPVYNRYNKSSVIFWMLTFKDYPYKVQHLHTAREGKRWFIIPSCRDQAPMTCMLAKSSPLLFGTTQYLAFLRIGDGS